MLILLLKKKNRHDTILIGEHIKIQLIDVLDDGQVRLGVEAPRDVIIDRQVIREAREKRIASVFEQHERLDKQ